MLEWNLTNLFASDSDLDEKIIELQNKANSISLPITIDANSLLTLLNNYSAIKELSTKILVYGSLKYYKDTSDTNLALKSKVEKINNEILTKLKGIENYIISIGYAKIIEFIKENPKLKVYQFYLKNLFRLQSHIQDSKVNEEIKENIDNINKLIAKQNKLTKEIKFANITVDNETYEITPSNMAKYLESRDREKRRLTFLSINSYFANKQDEYASILNDICALRIKNASLEQYSSVLDKSLFEENIPNTVIDTLISSVNNNLKTMQKHLKIKSNHLGISNPHIYDLRVPLDNDLKRKYTLDEAIAIIKEALKPLGNEYLNALGKILDGHIDATLNESKHQSITFSWQDYSFLNFRGSYVDIKNLIHELGHSVNYYLSKSNQTFLYADSTVFVGEIASIVNEILLNNYMLKKATTKDEKIFFLSKRIENYFTSVFKQTLYTEFESMIYKLRHDKTLTSNLLSTKYNALLTKYYGSEITIDQESQVEWTRLGHIYRHSYYTYQYATGLLIASSVVTDIFENQKLSTSAYLKFLKSGSSCYSTDLLKILNIDLTDRTTIDNGFKILENDIKNINELLSKGE